MIFISLVFIHTRECMFDRGKVPSFAVKYKNDLESGEGVHMYPPSPTPNFSIIAGPTVHCYQERLLTISFSGDGDLMTPPLMFMTVCSLLLCPLEAL